MYTLVVDDEMISRVKMNTIMKTLGETKMAASGTKAIEMFQSAHESGHPFDLVTLDIEMPDLLGTEVLKTLREIEDSLGIARGKGSVIMMVTAQQDRFNVYTAIASGCDDYIAKPFNIEIIKSKLARFGLIERTFDQRNFASPVTPSNASDGIFKSIQRALKTGELALPALPQTAFRFRELMDRNADILEIADLLKKDMVVTAKLIQMANSALNRGVEKVDTIDQAISRLGMTLTDRIVTTVTNQALFVTDQAKYKKMLSALWLHSLATAFGADALCQMMDHLPVVDIFAAGLLHDIGSLALVQIIAEMEKKGRFPEKISHESVQETAIAYHIMFGAKILKKWHFNDAYINIIRFHDTFIKDDTLTYEILVVHLANTIARSIGYTSFGQKEHIDIESVPSAVELRLERKQVGEIQEKVLSLMETSDLVTE